jgi:hypothetical protein
MKCLVVLLVWLSALAIQATPRPPLPPWPDRALNSWRFDDSLSWGGPLSPPLAVILRVKTSH